MPTKNTIYIQYRCLPLEIPSLEVAAAQRFWLRGSTSFLAMLSSGPWSSNHTQSTWAFFFSCNCRVCHLLSESSLAKLWWRWLNRSSCNGEDTSSHAVATPEYVAHTIKEVTHFYWFFCFFVCFLKMLLIKFVLDSFTHVYNMLRLPSPPTFSCLPSTPITLSLCRSLPPSHSCPFALRLTWFKQSHLCDHMCGTTH